MKYCGIERPFKMSVRGRVSKFNEKGVIAEKLGDKILKAVEMGADLGSPVPVKYDEKGQEGVDVMTSPNHDFFDIAENYGEQLAESVGAVPSDGQSTSTEGDQAPMADDPVTE